MNLERSHRSAFWPGAVLGVLLLSLYAPHPAAAEESFYSDRYRVRRWTTADGLPSNVIRSVQMTPDGYLWTSHLNDLSRFDGKRFTRVRWHDDTSTEGFGVVAVSSGPGEPYVVSYRGEIHRRHDGIWGRVTENTGDRPRAVVEGPDGALFVAGRSLRKVQRGQAIEVAKVPARALHLAPDGSLWCCGAEGVHHIVGSQVSRVSSESWGHGLSAGLDDQVLLHGRDKILFLGGERPILKLTTGLGRVHDALPDGDVVWWAADEGLFRVRLADLTPDRFDAARFERVLPSETTGSIRALCLDPSGNLWIGTEGRGLLCLEDTSAWPMTGPASDHTSQIVATAKELYLYGRGVLRRRTPGGEFVRELKAKGGRIGPASAGGVWVCSAEGTFRYEAGHRSPLRVPDAWSGGRAIREFSPGLVGFRFEDAGAGRPGWVLLDRSGHPAGHLEGTWIGTANDRSVWLDDRGELRPWKEGTQGPRIVSPLAPRPFVSCAEDRAGYLWLTSKRDGLWCLHGGTFRAVDMDHGLPSDQLGALLLDDRDELWINSRRGIFRVRTAQVLAVMDDAQEYLAATMVTDVEMGAPRAAKGPNGSLYFLSVRGWFECDPTRGRHVAAPPQAVVVAMRSHGHPADRAGSSRLPLGMRSIEIEYTAPAPATARDLAFSHRLLPIQEEWHVTGGRRFVEYAELPPGQYRFQVRARYLGQAWGEPSRELRFEVPPHFHEAAWFRWLVALGILAAGYWVYRLQTRLMRRHNRALRTEAEQRRLAEVRERALRLRARDAQEEARRRIAGELHDDIGTKLALLLLEVDSNPRGGGAPWATSLRMLGRDIQRISRTLHPSWIESVGLPAALRTLVEDAAKRSTAAIRFRVDVRGRRPAGKAAIDLYRIAQESLRNALRHGAATSIDLTLVDTDQGVEMSIRDDGIGFDLEASEAGLGLIGMRERAMGIGASLRIDSSPGGGTTVRVRLAPQTES